MKIGDIVEITSSLGLHDRWKGLRCEVVWVNDEDALLKPLDERPDGFHKDTFFWDKNALKVVSDEPSLEDRVKKLEEQVNRLASIVEYHTLRFGES